MNGHEPLSDATTSWINGITDALCTSKRNFISEKWNEPLYDEQKKALSFSSFCGDMP